MVATSEAVRRLGISRKTLIAWAEAGWLRFERSGRGRAGGRCYHVADVEVLEALRHRLNQALTIDLLVMHQPRAGRNAERQNKIEVTAEQLKELLQAMLGDVIRLAGWGTVAAERLQVHAAEAAEAAVGQLEEPSAPAFPNTTPED
ncbi:MerR family transcriptional regulator [Actinomadura roseirufa]|uniref:MerR family transcriptional regulator n=1 Tax=Actinomadura roseirufa TaxID=2094049 RepID=UPI0010419CA7|nr:MerR family transcriptional regulator [Actinomadura roseirufa]